MRVWHVVGEQVIPNWVRCSSDAGGIVGSTSSFHCVKDPGGSESKGGGGGGGGAAAKAAATAVNAAAAVASEEVAMELWGGKSQGAWAF